MHLYYKLHYEYDTYPDYDQTVGLMPLSCNLVYFLFFLFFYAKGAVMLSSVRC